MPSQFKLPKRLKWNARNKIRAQELLAYIPPNSVKLAFCDFQYRAVLDKQKYGNEGARQKGRAALAQMGEDQIIEVLAAVERTLKPSGHMVLWLDKYSVVEAPHLRWFAKNTKLQRVDMITWNKIVPGMGRRTRCYTEFALIYQRQPTKGSVWTDRGIMDCWSESADRSVHPHAKPVALEYRLIRATTKTGDVVLDPCAGGYGVLEACRASGRMFLGGDIAG